MKINEIHIYGYGKLENVIIKNLNQIQVFYGENEAGKSTIMSFIHSILFGFPTKQQTELRYEPKTHTKYGGKIIFQHPSLGQVIIERVKGKATGICVVKLEDGTIGGEEILAQLLKKMDKTMFQSIFSFNLDGLQNIHQVRSEDIGKFLFSTSVVGTDKLLKVENELKKELDTLYKPSGKRPVLNEKIKDLHELQIKVTEAQKKNDSYASLVANRIELEKSIQSFQVEMKDLLTKINRMSEWKNHFPDVQELAVLQTELEQKKSYHFPIDGMKRYESLVQLIKPLEAHVSGLVEKHEKLREQLRLIKTNPKLLELEVEVQSALANLPLDEQLATESLEIQYQLDTLKTRAKEIQEQIFYSLNYHELSQIDTSIFMKEKVRQAQEKLVRLSDQKQVLDGRFHEEKTALEQLESEITFFENQILPEKEKDYLHEELNRSIMIDLNKKELNEIQERIKYLEKSEQIVNPKTGKSRGQNSIVVLFLLFLAIWSGVKEEWWLLIATLSSFIILLTQYLKKEPSNKNFTSKDLLESSLERKKQLMKELSSSNNHDTHQLQAKIQHDEKLREQLLSTKLRWNKQQLRYDQIIQAYERWEMDTKAQEMVVNEIYEILKLSNKIPKERLVDALQMIIDLKELSAEEQRFQARLKQIGERRTTFHNAIKKLVDQFIPENRGTVAEVVMILRDKLKEAQQNAIQAESIQQKMKELDMDIVTGKTELQFLANDLNQLFNEAGVTSENEFRSKAKAAQRVAELVERKKAIENQIKRTGFSIGDYQQYQHLSQLEEQIVEWNQRVSYIEELVRKQQDLLADIKFQIVLLEEGGTYTELLHRYKQQKYEFEEQAKVWGSYAVAKHLLTKTIERYKNEKLPLLLKKAEEYLSFLTMGAYIHIHTNEEDGIGFIIERRDHTLFEANELSQATMEQVYVSIRLALATNLYETDKFPIIIDDSFVNFDLMRTKRIIQLLTNLTDHQILFFTCHLHLLEYFDQTQIMYMENYKTRVHKI